ncbi:large ribosomal subunit protein bL19c-like isoform X1 [Vicia villosa]|uniref:large ribosomal subunit protein bL19c-like isoform X1 n=2 Tax=Vicia villosa TaxID=3911 RepID=UPI00273B82C9|nr:large ribosomal subunit protein bL19c-like isoform X1 [Vicia villosa]
MASRRLVSSLIRSSISASTSRLTSQSCASPCGYLVNRVADYTTEGLVRGWRVPNTGSPITHGSMLVPHFRTRFMSTETTNSIDSSSQDSSSLESDVPRPIKFKRLDKTARHIMQILDKEAVEEVKGQREMPDIKPGYIVQLKVEVPENKRRVSIIKGIVIARRNAGLNTTFRIRRMVAGVGIESLFPLYSPNIKEIKVLDKKKVRRAKLYYLRDKMNALR